MAASKLVELDGRQVDGLAGCQFLRITAPGMYFLNYLSGRFTYLDIVQFDTPVWHDQTLRKLRANAQATEMYERLERVEWFLQYLHYEEQRSVQSGMAAFVREAFGDSISAQIDSGYRTNLERVVPSARLDGIRVVAIIAEVAATFDPKS